jgi:hypothetical protein
MYIHLVLPLKEKDMQPIDYLGATPLFLGPETFAWNLAQFEAAANAAKALGITSLVIKIADGTNRWYGGASGWQQRRSVVKPIINAVAYTFCYGDKFGAMQEEVTILSDTMTTDGIVIAQMEGEFDGRDDWAEQVREALLPVPGLFGVWTWADPSLHKWLCVLAKLQPCVSFWMPIVFTDFLAQQYHMQFAPFISPSYPILSLGSDFGPNNVIKNASEANSPIIALWKFPQVLDSPAIVQAIVALPHLQVPTTAVPTPLLQAIKAKVAELEALIAQPTDPAKTCKNFDAEVAALAALIAQLP